MSLVPNKIAGAYTATWKGVTLGHTNAQGFSLVRQCQLQPVVADAFGEGTIVDHIRLGERVVLQATFIQRDLTQLQSFIHPWAAAEGQFPVPGTHTCGVDSGELVLTPYWSGSLAGVAGWVYTFAQVMIDPSQVREMLNTRLREVSVTMIAYPYDDSGTIRFYEKAEA